jgi:excisionase family DNA binding protein
MTEREYMTVAEAQEYLEVTKVKISQLIAKGLLPTEPNPFDGRSKLVRRADVEALKAKQPARKRTPAAA